MIFDRAEKIQLKLRANHGCKRFTYLFIRDIRACVNFSRILFRAESCETSSSRMYLEIGFFLGTTVSGEDSLINADNFYNI